jgi:hypothetical protein
MHWVLMSIQVKVRVEVNQSHYSPGEGPEGSRRLRLPDFKTVDTVVKFSALSTGRLYPQEIFLVLLWRSHSTHP